MNNNKRPEYQLLTLIATHKLCDKAADMFLGHNLPIQYRISAEGTASNEIMDTLGLGSIDKGILISTVPKSVGASMLKLLHKQLRLDAVNSGIAFSIPLTGACNILLKMMNSTVENNDIPKNGKGELTMQDEAYTLIMTVVDRGYGGNVMDAARTVGAKGGTIIHSRGIENEAASAFWGLSVQEEKEIVLILADHEEKKKIMSAISEKFGMHSKAKGVVLSLPVDSVMGI